MKILAYALAGSLILLPVFPSRAFAQKESAPPAQPTVVSVNALVPSLAPAAETQTTQTKGGVRITLETDTFTAEAVPVKEDTQFQPGFKEIFKYHCPPGTQPVYYEHKYKPMVAVKPDHLVLHLHIDNQLPRVFRGSGALVQFNIAGKAVHVSPEGYGDFVNAIIPPRSSQDIDIVGPAIDIIPPQATIGIYFYDVVTKMDAAGNIQEKQNFEWYYSYQTQSVSKDVTLPPTTKSCGAVTQ